MSAQCNVPFAFRKTGTAGFVAIKSVPFGATAELTAQIDNAGSIEIRIDSSEDTILLPAGASINYINVDLNRIEIKGNGYVLIVTGQR